MADFKRLRLDQILVGDRLRHIDDDHALVIGLSMLEHGQQTPITVRATPAAEHAYTLVAGGHRYRGAELNEWEEIDVIVVKANGVEAQRLEIAENLHRNELSVIDRAIFVQTYRELYEEQHGTINSKGGRPKNEDKLSPLYEGTFSETVAMRLGLHPKAVKRLDQISRYLHPDVRAAIRGTDIADNQSALLKLAKLEPTKQRQAAIALRDEPDVKRAFTLLDDRPQAIKPDPQAALLSTLISTWGKASEKTQHDFRKYINADPQTDLEDFV
ncbi:ParB/RepB/Spo0J family partition protein [Ochrobactrum sp. MR28]|nr:ParB/RepB/Spo0J family partition protein [Ochrobactrum sp. MR28]MBX8817989.1 ParB/RepB/Spo0J family partition protein [Ochrobactrum sp. MR31]